MEAVVTTTWWRRRHGHQKQTIGKKNELGFCRKWQGKCGESKDAHLVVQGFDQRHLSWHLHAELYQLSPFWSNSLFTRMAFLVFCTALGKSHFPGFGIGNVASPEVGNDREGIQRKHGLVLHPKSKHTLQNNRETQMGLTHALCVWGLRELQGEINQEKMYNSLCVYKLRERE